VNQCPLPPARPTQPAELELRLRHCETLLAVSEALSGTLDATETMRRVARAMGQALGADMVGAYLLTEDRASLRPIAGYHVPRELLAALMAHPIPVKGHAAIEQAWAQRRVLWSSDMPGDRRVDRSTLERFPHQSGVFAPMLAGDVPLGGFFVVWWRERRELTDDEQRLVGAIATQAGFFVRHAALYQRAEDNNRAKDEFLAMLSHELRNPLGAISNAAHALERIGAGEARTSQLYGILARQSRHLAHMLDDLLDVAAINAGKVRLEHAPVDLADVVVRCMQALTHTGRTGQHHVDVHAVPAIVRGDRTRLEQIVTNLLDNALKYTPPGGTITVTVEVDDDAVVRVRDTGIGIPPDVLPRVFEAFRQGPRAGDRTTGGLGLGLAIVRRLVEMHGGVVTADSPGLDRGTEVVVRLPREASPAASAENA
jgi:signal transduction histidine kinase